MNARACAFELLRRWPRAAADALLEELPERAALSAADRALVTELFYGCLRNKAALERLLAKLSSRPPARLAGLVLQLGLYQLVFLAKIPPHAAVHESVELAKSRLSPAEARFVNAVLRRAARERSALQKELDRLRDEEPWTGFSHPEWVFRRWQSRYDPADTRSLLAWNNTPPPVYLRVNTLCAAGPPADLAVEPCPFHPLSWKVTAPTEMLATGSWSQGAYFVQDPSTLVAVDLLDPRPGEAMLDLCSAPGGKTTYAAQKMQNRGAILAVDSSATRLGRVGENCRRLGVSIVATLACDGTRADRCLHGQRFDRVLVDAPCSNTGVWRRRPDLRWRIRESELTRLAALQQQLLASAVRLLKPGGVLVYSTCSLEPEENERVAEWFGAVQPRFRLETTRSIFPPREGVDGVFVARWRQTSG